MGLFKRKATEEEYKSLASLKLTGCRMLNRLIIECQELCEKKEEVQGNIAYECPKLLCTMAKLMTPEELHIIKENNIFWVDCFLDSDDTELDLDDDEFDIDQDELEAEINSRKKAKAEKESFNDDDWGFTEDSDDDDWGFTEESDDDKNSDTSEMEEKLTKLKKLLDKGLISESDYNKRKEKLLDEMLNDGDD